MEIGKVRTMEISRIERNIKHIESIVVGLSWNEIKSIYDDCADTLMKQVYYDRGYWNCIFENDDCVKVEFAFYES